MWGMKLIAKFDSGYELWDGLFTVELRSLDGHWSSLANKEQQIHFKPMLDKEREEAMGDETKR